MPVAPRHEPARTRRRRGRHEVEPRCPPRMTAAQPRQNHPAAGPEPVAIERLVGIVGAGRQVPALKADQCREAVAIGFDQPAPGQTWCMADTMDANRHPRRRAGSGFVSARRHLIYPVKAAVTAISCTGNRHISEIALKLQARPDSTACLKIRHWVADPIRPAAISTGIGTASGGVYGCDA